MAQELRQHRPTAALSPGGDVAVGHEHDDFARRSVPGVSTLSLESDPQTLLHAGVTKAVPPRSALDGKQSEFDN